MRLIALFAATLLATGCATQRPRLPPPTAGLILPMEAVRAANDNPRRGISGTFAMLVQATAITDEGIFLNSERDYRHPLALTVRIPLNMQEDVERQLGLPINQLVNRRVLVTGTARQTRINFSYNGIRTDKYYFQTHISVPLAEQLSLAP